MILTPRTNLPTPEGLSPAVTCATGGGYPHEGGAPVTQRVSRNSRALSLGAPTLPVLRSTPWRIKQPVDEATMATMIAARSSRPGGHLAPLSPSKIRSLDPD